MALITTESWRKAWPGSSVGALAAYNLANPASHPELDKARQQIEDDLRSRFAGQDKNDLRNLPVLQAYAGYYGKYKKTYHVQLQIESVAWKGKSIPKLSAMVTSMFAAELKNMLLTAGHDLDRVVGPVRVLPAAGEEVYTLMNGQEQVLKPEDMYMADEFGVISSILSGPDRRTQITPETRNALFCVYAPAGIGVEAVRSHLGDIADLLRIFSPDARIELPEVHTAPTPAI